MAKPNTLVMKIVFIGVPVLIAVGLLPNNPPEAGKYHPSALVNPNKKTDPYDADSKVQRFPLVNGKITNSFKPGIIPSTYTNSKDPWIYTGSIEVNGSKQALLENKTTGEAVFLSPGDVWQGFKLLNINGDSIVVTGIGSGPGGQAKTLSFSGVFGGQPVADGAAAAVGYSQE